MPLFKHNLISFYLSTLKVSSRVKHLHLYFWAVLSPPLHENTFYESLETKEKMINNESSNTEWKI